MKIIQILLVLLGLIVFAQSDVFFRKEQGIGKDQGDENWLAPQLDSISLDFDDGDLLFVNNQGMWSDIASRFSQLDKRFGHVGVFFRDREGKSKIIHAHGDPLDTAGKVRVDSLELFVSSTKNLGWFGWDVDDEVREAIVSRSLYYVKSGYGFNRGFELGKDGRVYCTELVWRAFLDTQNIDLVPDKRNAFSRYYIGIDDLINHPFIYERGYWFAPGDQ